MTKDEIAKITRALLANSGLTAEWEKNNQAMLAGADTIKQQAAKIKELEAKEPRRIPVTEKEEKQ